MTVARKDGQFLIWARCPPGLTSGIAFSIPVPMLQEKVPTLPVASSSSSKIFVEFRLVTLLKESPYGDAEDAGQASRGRQ